MNDGYYIRYGYPKPRKLHICKLPNWWDRWLVPIKLGAIWHCCVCGKEYIWTELCSYEATWKGWDIYNG